MSQPAPKPHDLAHHFSKASKNRRPNPLKEYYKYLFVPGMCNFSGGLPHTDVFPFQALDLSLDQPTRHPVSNSNSDDRAHGPEDVDSGLRVHIPRCSDSDGIDLNTALQYGSARGYPPLYGWLRRLVNSTYHPNIPYEGGADVTIDCGSSDGLSKVFELLFNAWDQGLQGVEEREGLVVDEFVYGPPLAQIRPKNLNIVPAAMDAEGMLAYGDGSLSDVLENWDFSKGKRPHVVYIIPTGQNPTSGVLSFTRRKEIYAVCSRFDLVLVEDDPYWNMAYPEAYARSLQRRGLAAPENFPADPARHNYCTGSLGGRSTGYGFLDRLVPSFLSLDTDGRVVRLDSFSKSVAPGCRLGWITAQPGVCEQLVRITDDTTQQPSGFAQAVVARLVGGEQAGGGAWGPDGWVRWLEGLGSTYERRMVRMATVLEENRFTSGSGSGSGPGRVKMYDFQWPMGGMFLWVQVSITSHPLAAAVGPRRLMRALWHHCTQQPYRILTVPGADFAATDAVRTGRGYLFFRFCFAAVEEGLLEVKSRLFAEACRDFWSMQSSDDIDRIMGEADALDLTRGL